MSNPRSREFFARYLERLQDVHATAALEGRRATRAELDRAQAETQQEVREEISRHDRLLADIDQRIRTMPPIPIAPAGDAPAPDPNELSLALRMEVVRQRREQRKQERQERMAARQRARDVTASPRVDTTEAFAPKRKLDLD